MRLLLNKLVRWVLTHDNVVWLDKNGCLRSPDCYGLPCPDCGL